MEPLFDEVVSSIIGVQRGFCIGTRNDGLPLSINLHLQLGFELRSAVGVALATRDFMASVHMIGLLRIRAYRVDNFSWTGRIVLQCACGADVCVSEVSRDVGACAAAISCGTQLDLVVEIMVRLVLVAAGNVGGVLPDDLTSFLITPHVCT